MAAARIIRRLAELLDVSVSSPADGEVLTYDSGTSKWKNEAAAGGGGAGVSLTISTTAPADPTEGQLWLNPLEAANSFQLYAWDSNGSSWVQASAGVGGGDDTSERQVGILIGDPDDGNLTGLQVTQSQQTVNLLSTDADGDNIGAISTSAFQTYMDYDGNRFTIDAGGLRFNNLPETDPHVFGYLWRDASGFVKFSVGA